MPKSKNEFLYQKSLFVFRRDLRLVDNIGLLAALKLSRQVVCVFIFDSRQISNHNQYLSLNALQFMLASLKELEGDIKKHSGCLYFFSGDPDLVVDKLISELKIEAVFVNQDYTPFSLQRDKHLKRVCDQAQVDFVTHQDYLLTNPAEIKTLNGKKYQVFTAFYKNAQKIPVALPVIKNNLRPSCFYNTSIARSIKLAIFSQKILPDLNPKLATPAGRIAGLKILKSLNKFKNYIIAKDLPALPTTHLSAHLKFGTISAREAFYAVLKQLGPDHPLLRQLYWRDFFTYVAYYNPAVFGKAFNPKFSKIKWQHDAKKFKLWCAGQTGFPIVDAGMRQLNETGFMHNRVRMITASFLVKDLHLDWQAGEKYFATKLVDYDPAVNNGNWQWVAGTGCDAQPYFRVFNPWLQQKKFDHDCEYIKTWVPELKNFTPKIIHNWFKVWDQHQDLYHEPILNHAIAAKQALELYLT